jgi:hypothetical protein
MDTSHYDMELINILTKTFLEYISYVLQCYLPANTID